MMYNILATPVTAGALYPALGIMLRPARSVRQMSRASNIVALNMVLPTRVAGELDALAMGAGAERGPA